MDRLFRGMCVRHREYWICQGWVGLMQFRQDFWFQTSQDLLLAGSSRPPARFTRTATTFCVITFDQPTGGEFTVQKRLPLLPGDKIFLMHPDPSIRHTELQWNVTDGGKTIVQISDEQVKGVQDAWAFQIQFNVG